MRNFSGNQYIKKKVAFQNGSRKTKINGYDKIGLQKFVEGFLKQFYLAKLSILKGNLQEYLD